MPMLQWLSFPVGLQTVMFSWQLVECYSLSSASSSCSSLSSYVSFCRWLLLPTLFIAVSSYLNILYQCTFDFQLPSQLAIINLLVFSCLQHCVVYKFQIRYQESSKYSWQMDIAFYFHSLSTFEKPSHKLPGRHINIFSTLLFIQFSLHTRHSTYCFAFFSSIPNIESVSQTLLITHLQTR